MSDRDRLFEARKRPVPVPLIVAIIIVLAVGILVTWSILTTQARTQVWPSPSPPGRIELVSEAEYGTWVVSDDAVGPIRLGMTADELWQVVPYPDWEEGGFSGCSVGIDVTKDDGSTRYSVAFVALDRVTQEVVSIHVAGLNAEDEPNPRMADGIGIGSPLHELEAAYPDGEETMQGLNPDVFAVDRGESALIFDLGWQDASGEWVYPVTGMTVVVSGRSPDCE